MARAPRPCATDVRSAAEALVPRDVETASSGRGFPRVAMALLDLLLNRRNVTNDWVAALDVPLVVDLDVSSFCGVPLGGPLRDLSRLGPADGPPPPGPRARVAPPGILLDRRRKGRATGRVRPRHARSPLLYRPVALRRRQPCNPCRHDAISSAARRALCHVEMLPAVGRPDGRTPEPPVQP